MMGTPVFWIVAGPNGAGKTSLVQTPLFVDLLSSVKFINPDAMCLRLLQERGYPTWNDCPMEILRPLFIQAAEEAYSLLESGIRSNELVGVESVMSTDKYRPLIEQVKQRDGFFGMIYIGLSSPSLSAQRVKVRVSQGGHDVPADKLAERWHRSLEKLPTFLSLASQFWVFDNSSFDDQRRLTPIAEGIDGRLISFDEPRCFPELRQALKQLKPAD
jgi:predicted ABC-type ATPase